MTDTAEPPRIILEGGTLDRQELQHATPPPVITSDAGERYEQLTDRQGQPEHDIYGRLRYRLVW